MVFISGNESVPVAILAGEAGDARQFDHFTAHAIADCAFLNGEQYLAAFLQLLCRRIIQGAHDEHILPGLRKLLGIDPEFPAIHETGDLDLKLELCCFGDIEGFTLKGTLEI
jgi:hypothetical protein